MWASLLRHSWIVTKTFHWLKAAWWFRRSFPFLLSSESPMPQFQDEIASSSYLVPGIRPLVCPRLKARGGTFRSRKSVMIKLMLGRFEHLGVRPCQLTHATEGKLWTINIAQRMCSGCSFSKLSRIFDQSFWLWARHSAGSFVFGIRVLASTLGWLMF